jgi:SAM-dependent methyltransferase
VLAGSMPKLKHHDRADATPQSRSVQDGFARQRLTPMQISIDRCPVCGSVPTDLEIVRSEFSAIDFQFRRCDTCGLAFVANPRSDFGSLYDRDYYAGRGADPLVAYIDEMENADTIRQYEWRGIIRAVTSVTDKPIRWLDYGCGLGGLVRAVRDQGVADVYGFDEGWSAAWMLEHGLPLVGREELDGLKGCFDIVTAIEVVEHVPDPVGLISHIASLLKPGGLFFLTTGNAEPHRNHLTRWSYVHPDVHIAYFEPRTLTQVYRRTGLEPFAAGFLPGYEDIIRYKVLKTLRIASANSVERALPWSAIGRIVDYRHRVTALPLARKP